VLLLAALLWAAGPAAAADLGFSGDLNVEARRLVEAWRQAWEAGDVDAYIGFYAPSFRSRGMDRQAWLRYKETVFRRSGTISVRIDDLEVESDGPRVAVRFDQRYVSDILEDHGRKTLILESMAGGLKIVRETWKAYSVGPAPPPAPEPEVPFEPVVARTWGENLPADHVPAPREAPARLPSFEPVVAEEADEVWTRERIPRPDLMPARSRESFIPSETFVVEEIVAKVNGMVVTKSELEEREREGGVLQEIYQEYSGDDLVRKIQEHRTTTVQELVDELVLLQRADDLAVNVEGYVNRYLEDIKEESGVTTDAELEELLEKEGVSLVEFKDRVRRRKVPQRLVFEEVTSRIHVDEEEVQAYYDEHPEQFQRLEMVEVREIVLLRETGEDEGAVRRAADDVYQRLLDGASFEEMARRVSETPSAESGGRLGTFRRDEMSPELADVVFALGDGEISIPVRTTHGYHIMVVDSRIPADITPFDEVSEQIYDELHKERWDARIEEYLEQLYRTNIIQINEQYQEPQVASSSGPAPTPFEASRR